MLQFRVELKDQHLTRGILSTIRFVFDCFGMLLPLILVGKKTLQELCRDRAEWYDTVPEPLRYSFNAQDSSMLQAREALEKLNMQKLNS